MTIELELNRKLRIATVRINGATRFSVCVKQFRTWFTNNGFAHNSSATALSAGPLCVLYLSDWSH